MSQNLTDMNVAAKSSVVMFDHEKLDVYQVELQFIAWVTLLNTAEGNGKRQRQVRAKFFDDARGSATECAACLDALVAKRVAVEARIIEGKKMLLRIVSMLCGLVERFDAPVALHDGVGGLETDSSSSEVPVAKIFYSSKSSRTRTRTRTRTI